VGTAAALFIPKNLKPKEPDLQLLRKSLCHQGILLAEPLKKMLVVKVEEYESLNNQ
jgi:hypothetical protein